MGVNDDFDPRRKYIPHAKPNYGPGKYNFEVDYYRQTYFSPESVNSSQKPKSHLILIILFALIGRQVMHWAASLMVACKHSPSIKTLLL